MLAPGDRVLVACSGGPDSLALLHALRRLAPRLGIRLRAVYVDHGLRPAAAAEGARVVAAAARLDLAGEVVALGLRTKSMEAAREARYAALERLADTRGATKIAVAHTLSDQAETVLMRLVRGAGVRGLSGMPPVRGRIIRPLCEVSRAEVVEFCRRQGLRPVRDPTNLKPEYLRNRVRHELLPLLRRENPRIERALAHLAEHLRQLDGAIVDAARRLDPSQVAALRAAGPAVRARALSHAHLVAIERLLESSAGTAELSLPGGVRLERRYGELFWVKEEIPVGAPGQYRFGLWRVEIAETDRPEGAFTFDLDAVPLPWTLRAPRAGDRMRPRGLSGSKKLQDIFVDAKVPRPERAQVPVLVWGSDILCVGGLRASELGRPQTASRRLLRVVLTPRAHV